MNISLKEAKYCTVTPMSGNTVDELMEYWEAKHMQIFYAEEYMANDWMLEYARLYNEQPR